MFSVFETKFSSEIKNKNAGNFLHLALACIMPSFCAWSNDEKENSLQMNLKRTVEAQVLSSVYSQILGNQSNQKCPAVIKKLSE